MKEVTNRRNENGVKSSCDCYRNLKIKGVKVFFENRTADSYIFESEKKEAKELGLRVRMIDGELYREVA